MTSVVLVTGPLKPQASALLDFMGTVTDISMSAFDRSVGKQVSVDRLSDVLSLSERKAIKPGTLEANPAEYARVALMQFDGPVSRTLDFSKPNALRSAPETLSKDIERTLFNPESDSSPLLSASDADKQAASNAIAAQIAQALKDGSMQGTLVGYAIEPKFRGVQVNLVEVAPANPDLQALRQISEKNPIQTESAQWSIGQYDQDSVQFTRSTYSAEVIEDFSAIGYKAALAYKSIHKASEVFVYSQAKAQGTNEVSIPKPSQYIGYALPFEDAMPLLQDNGKVPSYFVAAGERYSATFKLLERTGETITEQGFVDSVREVSAKAPASGENLLSTAVASRASWHVYESLHDRRANELKMALEQPCPANVASLIEPAEYARAFEYAYDCAENYGYSTSVHWVQDFHEAMLRKETFGKPALLGFEKGVPVFNVVEKNNPGFVTGYVRKDPVKGIDPYSGLFIGIDSKYTSVENFRPKDALLASKFILHHEMGHVLYNHWRDWDNSDDPKDKFSYLRSMDIESQMDVYATQKLISLGYDKERVLAMHKDMVNVFLAGKAQLQENLDDQYVLQAKALLRYNGAPVPFDAVEEHMEKTFLSDPLEIIRRAFNEERNAISGHIIENSLRHEEVKRHTVDFKAGDTPVLEIENPLTPRQVGAPKG